MLMLYTIARTPLAYNPNCNKQKSTFRLTNKSYSTLSWVCFVLIKNLKGISYMYEFKPVFMENNVLVIYSQSVLTDEQRLLTILSGIFLRSVPFRISHVATFWNIMHGYFSKLRLGGALLYKQKTMGLPNNWWPHLVLFLNRIKCTILKSGWW